ncbi:MAG: 50S ribosomal protein L29 [Leptospirales bacterium]
MANKKEKAKAKKQKGTPKLGTIREMTTPELEKLETDLRKELYDLRSKIKVASQPNVRLIRETRKTIARILTVLKLREINVPKVQPAPQVQQVQE